MAPQQGIITITGRVGNDPQPFGRNNPPTICTFRLGCTRGYYNPSRQWQSLPTTWITVKAFRTLAANVLSSLHTGDPVIVSGVLGTEEWTTGNGEKRTKTVIEASGIGHDLNYGIGFLNRQRRERSVADNAGNAVRGGYPAGNQGGFLPDGTTGQSNDPFVSIEHAVSNGGMEQNQAAAPAVLGGQISPANSPSVPQGPSQSLSGSGMAGNADEAPPDECSAEFESSEF